ncbi:MAG: class IV adenylate cyclase [Phycisphaeraceae bacterium]|nr:class IV adenylate cyclase [Phycisphaerae bacterium]MBX3393534.1 class IV adenylate cyclase [Phycisphaeraceae bacterium]
MHNVEFKAELRDLPLARSIAKAHGAAFIDAVEQTDTYFRVPAGRLKKRETMGEPVEYIFYDRSDRSPPKLSHFTIYTEAQATARFGLAPMPVWLVVKKVREIYLLGNVRIHLDTVEKLGVFLEFEALVGTNHSVAACNRSLSDLREIFAPVLGEPISCGYSDLLDLAGEVAPLGGG